MKERFPSLISLYLPWISTVPFNKGFRWMPTWKSTPNDDRHFVEKNRQGKPVKKVNPNIFTSVKYEIGAFAQQLAYIHSLEGIFSPGILFAKGRILLHRWLNLIGFILLPVMLC